MESDKLKGNKIPVSRGLYILGCISIIVTILILIAVLGYFLLEKEKDLISNSREIMRVSSPDSLFEAVMMADLRGGAFVGISYDIYIAEKNKKLSERNLICSFTKTDSVRLVWRDPRFLNIHYRKAKIIHFENSIWFGYDKKTLKVLNELEVRLMPDSSRSF